MYDIRQFKPTLYLLIIIGMSGFALAAQSPGMWLFSLSIVLLNAWLVYTGRFRPLPRLVSNGLTIIGVVVMLALINPDVDAPILIVGQFLILLQIIKLFEQRANRDYAQLLILNLLQMVAGAISTASLFFGVILLVYLLLLLYCCLVFHLKQESDYARHLLGYSEASLNPATLSRDRKQLAQSLRRLVALTATFAISGAILTFLFFPRIGGAGMFGPLKWTPAELVTGFSDSVSFQNVAMITQNTEAVAWVTISRDGTPYQGELLLRGNVLDRYTGSHPKQRENRYEWIRTTTRLEKIQYDNAAIHTISPARAADVLHEQITVAPLGTNSMFVVGGLSGLWPDRASGMYEYSPRDSVLQRETAPPKQTRYSVEATDYISAQPGARLVGPSEIDPRIAELARMPQISGTNELGPLAEQRSSAPPSNPYRPTTPLDIEIATNIQKYLRTNFNYTLDLTQVPDKDPIVAFLDETKQGHCEFFAGAMALMCQSLGIQARVVVGFKSDEFNPMFNYYTIRQSHAHAWVEVLDESGIWRTFDPTASTEAAPAVHTDGWWQQLSSVFSFLEYTWQTSVIAYDQNTRASVVQGVERQANDVAQQGSQAASDSWDRIAGLWRQFREARSAISVGILSIVMTILPATIVVPIFLFLWEKWRLRRRARRIGLESLPGDEQIRLARQLGFYDSLTRLLERHRIVRPAHLTPMEFSESLTFLPIDAFDIVQRITAAFYRVRYGGADLDPEQQRRFVDSIGHVEAALGAHH